MGGPGTEFSLVGMYELRISDPAQGPAIAKEIDRRFANSEFETKTSTEKAFAQSFANQIGSIGSIVTGIVGVVFFTLLLVAGNTMAQAVRERTNELGVLKTVFGSGFDPAQYRMLLFGLAMVVLMVWRPRGLISSREPSARLTPPPTRGAPVLAPAE